MIYIDHKGNIKVQESRSVQERGPSVFTPEVQQNFLQILGESIGCHQPIQAKHSRSKSPKRNGSMTPLSDRHSAEHDSDTQDLSGSVDMKFRIGDTQNVIAYYERAFYEFQQLNCRTIAKAFICAIEPRKQSKYPYSGKPPGSAPGTRCDPEKTKPEWWPSDVQHKEPDHIMKEDRVQLLVHILCRLGSYGITADKLEEVARATRRKFQDQSRAEVIFEILWVRKLEERFEQSDIHVIVDIKNLTWKEISPPAQTPPHPEQGQMAPEPIEQEYTPLTTPTEDLPSASICSLPGSLSHPTMRPQYTNLSPQSRVNTATTAEMISTHRSPVFNYSARDSFPASASSDRHTGPLYHYASWLNTRIQQDSASQANCGAPATTQG
ncbi:unnamed protein product [Penicillium egyptiacum]|uniref:Subtelomeric hrmA-associated cluster protein AFUB-079030/YDR124W-like helical bundle domain-containing protein n=1 Tax=Penicillium egyptiacum TaxID=1303716 RepID=A0A9W4KK07_9EURO|nr:unnamed protein product [Penicillium egyptiacum]